MNSFIYLLSFFTISLRKISFKNILKGFRSLRNDEYRVEQLIAPDEISKIPWNYYRSI